MQELEKQLTEQYGDWDFESVTRTQAKFLLDRCIADNRDDHEIKTVNIEEIVVEENMIEVSDVYLYEKWFDTNRYTKIRLKLYKELTKDKNPTELGDFKYILKLPDNTKIQVEFKAHKEKIDYIF